MTALAILVKFTIPEGSMNKFMEAAHHDAKHSTCLVHVLAHRSGFWILHHSTMLRQHQSFRVVWVDGHQPFV